MTRFGILTLSYLCDRMCTYERMITKRLSIELKIKQYEFLKKEAVLSGTTVSDIIRGLIQERFQVKRKEALKNYQEDPYYRREGSFNGPEDLSDNHDQYLYGLL